MFKKAIALCVVGALCAGSSYAATSETEILSLFGSLFGEEMKQEIGVSMATGATTSTESGSMHPAAYYSFSPDQTTKPKTTKKKTILVNKHDLPLGESFYKALVRAIQLDNVKKEICQMGYDGLKADFTDVDFSTREGKAIKNMADYCVVHGYGNDGKTFGLDRYLTKGQAYKIFVRMLVVNHTTFANVGGHWALEHYAAGRGLGLWDGVQDPGLLDDVITLGDFVRIFQNIGHAIDRVSYQFDGSAPQTKIVDYTKLQNTYIKRGAAAEMISHLLDRLYK